MLTDKQLLAIAIAARRCLQGGTILSNFPVGRCKTTSIFLMRWIETQGQPVSMHGVSGMRLDPLGTGDNQAHFWITVGDVIIDLTADQYADGPAPVIVSRASAWHDTFDPTTFPAASLSLGDSAQQYAEFARSMSDETK